MKQTLRWSLMLPAVVVGFVGSWIVYPAGRALELAVCPASLRSIEATTDLSQPDYSVTSATCASTWFQATDGALLVLAGALSILAATLIGHRSAPSHKRLCAAISASLAVGAIGVAFAHGP